MVTKPFFIYHNSFRSGWAKKILIMHIWQLTLLRSLGPRATMINPSQEDVTALPYSCRNLPFGQSVWYYDPPQNEGLASAFYRALPIVNHI